MESLGHNRSRRLHSIDFLRGVAALGVVICHVRYGESDPSLDLRFFLTLPLSFGALGVPLFIVLSGFCIHLSVARKMAAGGGVRANWKQFWKRRFFRLYPPYLAAMLLGLMIYQVCDPSVYSPFERIVALPYDILAHLLMFANLTPNFWAGSGDFPLWTLCMEEQLYALYALYLLLRRSQPPARVLGLILLVSVLWTASTLYHLLPESLGTPPLALGRWQLWPFGLWFHWALGATAAEAYAGSFSLPRWCRNPRLAAALVLVGTATSAAQLGRCASSHFVGRLPHAELIRPLLWTGTLLSGPALGLGFFIVLNRVIHLETQNHFHSPLTRPFTALGLFSYSLYLTHIPILRLLESLLQLDDSLLSAAIRFAVQVPVCIAFAWLFFRLIEARFLLSRPTYSTPPVPTGLLEPLSPPSMSSN